MNLFIRFKDKLNKILCGWPLYLTALKITGTCLRLFIDHDIPLTLTHFRRR